MTTTLHDRITEARRVLVGAGLWESAAALDAEVLARHVLGWDRATLLGRLREDPPGDFRARFEPLVARRAAREPVALITGHREFWGLDMLVTPDVLVPRPETELIVETVLAGAGAAGRRIADVGTGSGCLAVALAVEIPSAAFIATDSSPSALAVAKQNAQRHGVADRIAFVEGDLLSPLIEPVDVIVSNPPYIVEGTRLPPEIARFEPAAALFAGPDGLAVLRRLIGTAAAHLAAGGRLIVEFGYGQADEIEELARAAGWGSIVIRHDLQGIPRVAELADP